jgi:hypothetical protein
MPLKPFKSFTVTAVFAEAPCDRFILAGAAESARPGALTVSGNVVAAVSDPLVPVIVTVEVPGVAELEALSVNEL